ncbi:spore coat U domain-containing protein [Thermosynechococcus sp.]|uniref:Csu type fimbrial protein n=1 Tax=Thermosynechococcus sp. TaxID=2814275 RepID=UPI00391C1D62
MYMYRPCFLRLKLYPISLFLTAASGLLPLLTAQRAPAQTSPQTSNINIQATVKAACVIKGVQDINFGIYDPLGTHYTQALYAQGEVSVQCLPGTRATIQLSQGNYPHSFSSCLLPLRRMASGSAHLLYLLYRNSSYLPSAFWGCHWINDVDYIASNTGVKNFTVYGRIPAGEVLESSGFLNQLTPGTYTDTVQIIVSF